MKRLSFCLILALVFAGQGFLFAGGGASASQNAAPAAGEKMPLLIWGYTQNYSKSVLESFDLAVQEYKRRNPNIELTVEYPEPGTDYRQRYDTALMSGAAPAATPILPPVDVPSRVKNGTVKDITSLVENWDLYKQGLLNKTFDEAMKINNKWYAIIDEVYIAGTPYNKTTLKAGGGDPANLPKTWAEFAALGQKVTDPGVPRFGYLLVGMEWNAWPFTPWVWSAGGEMVRPNSDGSYRVAFNEEPGVDVAEFWNAMIWKYQITQKDVLKNWNDYRDDMWAGRGVFAFAQLENYSVDAEQKYGIPQDTFGIIPMPAKDANNKPYGICGGNVWIFGPGNSDAQTKAAFDFAVLASYDREMLEKRWAHENTVSSITSRVPGRTDMVDVKYNKYGTAWPKGWAEEFSALSQAVKLEPSCPNWNDLKNILAPYLQQILMKEGITRTEIKAILDKAAEECYSSYPASFKK